MYGFGLTGGLWGGAVGEQLAVPFADAMLVPLPDGLEPAAAASVADNIVDAYRHIGPHLPELMRRHGAAEVLILGALRARERYSGSVPLYTGLIARVLGADRVLLADARPHVRDHAARLGIRAIPPQELAAGDSAPLVVDATARGPGLARALAYTLPDGICSSLGGLHRSARIPMFQSYAANVAVHISRVHARTVIPSVLELMSTGRLAPELVTTTVAPLEDAPAALREHYRAGGIKTVLTAY
jgi:alcohol dehydrogenase